MWIAVTIALLAIAWQLAPAPLPSLGEVLVALGTLWTEHGLFDELLTSIALNAEALAWSTAIALVLAYATVIPALRPLVAALSKLRFTGMVGWAFALALVARDGHQLKVWMLVLGTAPFFVTSMAAVVAEIPVERFDHARSLGMSRTRVMWEVVVIGTIDRALEVLRQTAAIGWAMLTMVEGVMRSEGGIGAMQLAANKHLALDAVFALILVVLLVGIAQDYLLGAIRRAACPWR
jgi:NitT/TauT family transport system permease protein